MFLCKFIAFLFNMKQQLLSRLICTIHSVLNTIVRLPCYDMQWPKLKLFPGLCYHSLRVPIEVKLLNKEHFLKPMNVSLIEKVQHTSSGKCRRVCLTSYFSITTPMRFVSTLKQFSTYQFFDNNRHNYYKLQQYTSHL